MEPHELKDEPPQAVEYGTFKSYLIGFLVSVILVLGAYFITVTHLLSGLALDIGVSFMAVAQALVQLVLFFNLTREPKPRWNLVIFVFMVLIVLILVVGSIWIMHHLNYNMMLR
jgi:cytochrome o ubiquinol oxidase operon protein cyoD